MFITDINTQVHDLWNTKLNWAMNIVDCCPLCVLCKCCFHILCTYDIEEGGGQRKQRQIYMRVLYIGGRLPPQ